MTAGDRLDTHSVPLWKAVVGLSHTLRLDCCDMELLLQSVYQSARPTILTMEMSVRMEPRSNCMYGLTDRSTMASDDNVIVLPSVAFAGPQDVHAAWKQPAEENALLVIGAGTGHSGGSKTGGGGGGHGDAAGVAWHIGSRHMGDWYMLGWPRKCAGFDHGVCRLAQGVCRLARGVCSRLLQTRHASWNTTDVADGAYACVASGTKTKHMGMHDSAMTCVVRGVKQDHASGPYPPSYSGVTSCRLRYSVPKYAPVDLDVVFIHTVT